LQICIRAARMRIFIACGISMHVCNALCLLFIALSIAGIPLRHVMNNHVWRSRNGRSFSASLVAYSHILFPQFLPPPPLLLPRSLPFTSLLFPTLVFPYLLHIIDAEIHRKAETEDGGLQAKKDSRRRAKGNTKHYAELIRYEPGLTTRRFPLFGHVWGFAVTCELPPPIACTIANRVCRLQVSLEVHILSVRCGASCCPWLSVGDACVWAWVTTRCCLVVHCCGLLSASC